MLVTKFSTYNHIIHIFKTYNFAEGEVCCNSADTEDCKKACTNMFQSELSPTQMQRQQFIESCESNSPKVTKCIKDVIKVTPALNTQKRM